jgi:hypothetical protein
VRSPPEWKPDVDGEHPPATDPFTTSEWQAHCPLHEQGARHGCTEPLDVSFSAQADNAVPAWNGLQRLPRMIGEQLIFLHKLGNACSGDSSPMRFVL